MRQVRCTIPHRLRPPRPRLPRRDINLCRRSYSNSSSPISLPRHPPPSGFTSLPTRSLIHVSGSDSPRFLHGLLTSSVHPFPSSAPPPSTPGSPTSLSQGFYSAFLTAQGRVLHDVFVYPAFGAAWSKLAGTGTSSAPGMVTGPEEDGFVVEVDSTERDGLLKHLKRHKLRSKVKLRAVEEGEVGVYAVWKDGEERWTSYGIGAKGAGTVGEGLGLVDQRAPGMGRRVLLSGTKQMGESVELEGLEQAELEQYHLRRYLRGVPEGQKEILRDQAFPMNSNLDVMGAIDFKKGCYIGQELTIRTHHTGVVRRRVMPVMLYDPSSEPPGKLEYDPSWSPGSPPSDSEFKVEGKRGKPGRWIAGVGNIGLATCRLEMMTDLVVTGEPSTFSDQERFTVNVGEDGEGIGVKTFVPDWIRGRIRPPKVQKRVE
ncbi:hypothetical protein CAC42_6022 [Sphaceloma murrayae]|uniref:Iron-sulfur cluster assembly factor IBA57 homolog, mitochondrial n=1 Tax=Sphaceloma murrayae TaxID=2082308 RepID=A0A2K1QV42_9PEZI|nr:hypothetical protein CAC42_6022 [Sphaceloma murrayae]